MALSASTNGDTTPRSRLTPISLAVVLLASGLAGCLGGASEAPVEATQTEPELANLTNGDFSDWTHNASWDLSDVPEGKDWILVEIVPEAYAHLEADVNVEAFNRDGIRANDDPGAAVCTGAWLGRLGGPAILQESGIHQRGATEAEAGVQTGSSEDRYYEVQAVSSGYGRGNAFAMGAARGQSTPLLFGIDDAAYWEQAADASMTAELSSDARFKWRIAEAGEFRCGDGVQDLDGGTLVRGPLGTYASDRSLTFQHEDPGYLWVLGGADIAHEVEVAVNGSAVWSSSWTSRQNATTGFEGTIFQGLLAPVAPGEVRLSVDRLEGARVAFLVYVWLEVPGWADLILQPQHPQRINATA